jgi:uncharacterized damage-inducible protein DinB
MVDELGIEGRVEPGFLLPEREMLEGWLEFHRATLLAKCEGLSDAQRRQRPVPTSELSLHWLVRHLADVERNWFQRVLSDQPELEDIWSGGVNRYHGQSLPASASWEDDRATYLEQCDLARGIAATKTLDDTGPRKGRPCSLRWIYVHMVEEYARHNGHADLLRELVDGEVGW